MGLEKGANGLIFLQRISPEIRPIIPIIHPISQNHFFFKDKYFLQKNIDKIQPSKLITLKNKFSFKKYFIMR